MTRDLASPQMFHKLSVDTPLLTPWLCISTVFAAGFYPHMAQQESLCLEIMLESFLLTSVTW